MDPVLVQCFLTLMTRKGMRDDICIKMFLSSLTYFSSPILLSGSKPISLHCSDSNVSPCRDYPKMPPRPWYSRAT